MEQQESPVLQKIKDVFKQQNISAEHVKEFYCLKTELENLKVKLRKETKGKCAFFTKNLSGDRVHLLALLYIANIQKLTSAIEESGMKKENKLDNVKYNSFKGSIYKSLMKITKTEPFK